MSYSNDESLLLERMKVRAPVLLLGAGFSRNAVNGKNKPLPMGGELAERLFDEVLLKKKTIDKEDLEEYRKDRADKDLKKVCQDIRIEDLCDERDSFLVAQFSNCRCRGDDFRLKMLDYPWNYIYTLNIDDIVERLYREYKPKARLNIHIMSSSSIDQTADINLYKMHGCVTRRDLGFVFDEDEYRRAMAAPTFPMQQFANHYFTNDVIFLGTEFQENDLQMIIEQYQLHVESKAPFHCFFISPSINNRMLKKWIREKENYHHINWTAEKFFHVIHKEITQVEDLTRKMQEYGMFFYNEVKNDRRLLERTYSSDLYLGDLPRPLDFFMNYDIPRIETLGVAQKLGKEKGCTIVTIYGDAYVGKTCAAIRLGVDLMSEGFEFIIYNIQHGTSARVYRDHVLEYLTAAHDRANIAILSEDMPYFYSHLKYIVDNCPRSIERLVLICTGNKTDHTTKKYQLDTFEHVCEIYISEHTKDGRVAENIYNKLLEKDHLNRLRLYGPDKKNIKQHIRQVDDIIEVLYESQRGRQFVNYFDDYVNNLPDNNEKQGLHLLACLSALGVNGLPRGLFCVLAEKCGIGFNIGSFYKNYSDVVRIEKELLYVRCSRLLWPPIVAGMKKDQIINWISIISNYLASIIREKDETAENELFQKITKVRMLKKRLYLGNDEVEKLYLKIYSDCKHLSYYWIQYGILLREEDEFEEANNALSEAETRRGSSSYHILHAKAKNFMSWGIWAQKNEPTHDSYYFVEGKKQLEELIQHGHVRYLAYSIHTYTDMMLRYHESGYEIMSETELEHIASMLAGLQNMQKDGMWRDISKRFLQYCGENGYQSSTTMEIKRRLAGNNLEVEPWEGFDSDDLYSIDQ